MHLNPSSSQKPENQNLDFRLPEPITNYPGLSFDGGASPNDIDRMSPDMGEALALVPIGHEPVAVFPPFSVHRRVPAIGVIFSEKKSQKFKRRNGRKSSSFMEKVMPSEFSSRLWNFLGNVGTNVLCMRPRVQRYLFSSRSEDHDLGKYVHDLCSDGRTHALFPVPVFS